VRQLWQAALTIGLILGELIAAGVDIDYDLDAVEGYLIG